MIEEFSPDVLRERASAKWITFGPDVIPSNPAEMDFGVAPAIQKSLEQMVARQQYGYSPKSGTGLVPAVAAAFSRRMENQFGWTTDPSDVLVLADLVQATAAGILAFSDKGDGVSLQVPSYPVFLNVIAGTGRKAVVNPMIDNGSRFDLDFTGLAAAIDARTRILLLCHPHNPTGRAFAREELEPLVNLAVAHDMVIISDEIHADLVFDGRRHEPLAKMFPEVADRILTFYSATKSFNIPGLRCAVVHFGSKDLRKHFEEHVPPFVLGSPSVPGMIATVTAWDEAQPWCDELLAYLQENRDYLVERVAREIPGAALRMPEATYLAWLDLSAIDLPVSAFDYLLERARVGCGDGRNFGPGYEQCVRLNFAASKAMLKETVDRIVTALAQRNAAANTG